MLPNRRIPSAPVGYADDLAACCRSERKLDGALEVVYHHGCTWRYCLNAKKSGIMVFGENSLTNRHNSKIRNFKLGTDRVREKLTYDYVGITSCLYEYNAEGVTGRIEKARKALNAITGLGIRSNGLTASTCSIIFWVVIAPIALFGSEMWVLSDKSARIIEEFQNFAGKRVQRLFNKSPNICSFFGLGWIRLERVIEIKKMMFIRSILALDDEEISRWVFCARTDDFLNNTVRAEANGCGSVVFDLLNVANIFGMLADVVGMVRQERSWPKADWKRRVWKRAWELDKCFWQVQAMCHRSLDLMVQICGNVRYLIWWQMSDENNDLIRSCRNHGKAGVTC